MLRGFDYAHWLSTARKVARRSDEAADLLHDALIEAIRADRVDFSDATTRRWFSGVLKNRASMDARSAVRRARREKLTRLNSDAEVALPEGFIEALPRAARSVAVLALSGMRRDEIISALNLAPTAFRQRLSTIRRACEELPLEQRCWSFEDVAQHPRPDPEFELGLIRRALLIAVKWSRGLGVHDPDGHLIVIERDSSSQSSSSRQRSIEQEHHE